MVSLREPPLFGALAGARSVLIAGAGGGFDVYAGLPLALSLLDAGVPTHLANLSFAYLDHLDAHPDPEGVSPLTISVVRHS